MSPALIVSLIILFAALVIIAIIRAAGRQKQAAAERLQRLGFFELPGPDPELLSALRGLVPTKRQQLSVGAIYRRTAGNADMYAFYPDITTNSSTTLAVRVPHLDLPLFRLLGKIEIGGMLGGLVNDLILRAVGRDLPASTWTSDPTLGERYLLFAEDPERMERLLVESWGSLLRDPRYHISIFGRGNLLAFSRSITMRSRRQKPESLPTEDPFASFVQIVDLYVRSLRTGRWDRSRSSNHTVA